MALKVLLLRKKLTERQEALKELERAAEAFEAREKELEADIEEAKTDEERSVVEEAVETFEQERSKNSNDQKTLRGEIEALEKEIRETEETARQARSGEPAPNTETRKDGLTMNTAETRTRFFGMTVQQRDAFLAREDVREFLQRTRELGQQKRAVSGAELLIPTVVLDLLRETIGQYSKLISHVNLRPVSGKARQRVAGAIPEAVWTEMCATLNELSISFTAVEVDGYKVGGYIAICNATLEDSDINLAQEIITMLGASIGYALDKAILYGTGTKMPLGIVTRLAQAEKPSSYPDSARPWVNLKTSNILTVTAANSTGIKLFQSVLKNFGAAKSKYSRGVKFWAMNETTFNTLMSEALSINAAGAVVSGMQTTMPVVGGAVVLLDFIPDNNIIAGYGDLYLLAERAGTSISQSEHAMFIEDQTVFKGTARYDGLPVIAEAFVVIGINAATPTTSMTFADDKANAAASGGTETT